MLRRVLINTKILPELLAISLYDRKENLCSIFATDLKHFTASRKKIPDRRSIKADLWLLWAAWNILSEIWQLLYWTTGTRSPLLSTEIDCWTLFAYFYYFRDVFSPGYYCPRKQTCRYSTWGNLQALTMHSSRLHKSSVHFRRSSTKPFALSG